MGCTGSKQARNHFHGPKPYNRTQSLPINLVNCKEASEPSSSVTLTSSTIGSLVLDPEPEFSFGEEMMKNSNDRKEVNSWSEMIDKHCKWIPVTPTKTPSHEPEVINVWELMEGLEDSSPIYKSMDRSFTFQTSRNTNKESESMKGLEDSSPTHKSIDRSFTFHTSRNTNKESKLVLSNLDPDIVYAFLNKREIPEFKGLVKARINAFQEKIDARKSKVADPAFKRPPGSEKKVTFYFTSLRGIRKTFEDCWDTKVIIRSYGIVIDERDVSMHGGYREELKDILGEKFNGKLPQIFTDGQYIGGAEEVMKLHEGGELGEILARCESVPVKKEGSCVACNRCGDMHFVPCETCSGSCKVFVLEKKEDEEEEEEEMNGGFRRCMDCNENGLIRCPLCC